MSELLVNTIKKADGTGSLTIPADTGTVVTKDGSNDVTLNNITATGVYLGGTGAANYLDDYEEGTWTPRLEGNGGSIGSQAYSGQHGRYIKVGGLVVLTGYINMTNKGSWTGVVRIKGFPFTVENNSRGYGGTVFYGANLSLPTSSYGIGAYPEPNTTDAPLFASTNSGSINLSDYVNQINNTSQVGAFTIAYYTTT